MVKCDKDITMIPEVANRPKRCEFGNFGGDCPVFKSGRKGHFQLNTEENFPEDGMLSSLRMFMSVAPKPQTHGFICFGFCYIAVRNARHSGLKREQVRRSCSEIFKEG